MDNVDNFLDQNPCLSDPCLNGGSCSQVFGNLNEFTCTCFDVFTGTFCETGRFFVLFRTILYTAFVASI